MRRFGDRHRRLDSRNLLPDRADLLGRHQIAARQDRRVRPLQAADRLAQQAARQQIAVPPRAGGVDQDEVEIALQAPMLEAIVQHQDVALQLLDRRPRQGDSISSLQMRHIGEVLFQHQCLIVPARYTSVTSAQQCHLQAALAKEPRDPFDARRLAGAADRQVADADDRDYGLVDRLPAAVEGPVSHAHAQVVTEAQGPKACALQRRPDAGAVAANQCVKSIVQSALVHTSRNDVIVGKGKRCQRRFAGGGKC